MKKWLGAFALTLLSLSAHAQTVCYRWFNTDSVNGLTGQYWGSMGAMGAAVTAYRNANPITGGTGTGQYTSVYTMGSCSGTPSGTTGTATCTITRMAIPAGAGKCSGSGGTVNCTGVFGASFTARWEVNPAGCATPSCDTNPVGGAGTQFAAADVPGANEYCNALTGCKMKVKSRSGGSMVVEHTTDACAATSSPAGGQPSSGTPENCVAVGSGEYCSSSTGDGQCGYIDDSYVCLKKVKPNECLVAGAGSRICGAAANTTPPVPDNGTPGVLATPDGTMSQAVVDSSGVSTTNNFNYYSPSTVSGSSRNAGSTGAAPSGGSPGYGDGEGDGEGEDDSPECVGTTCGEAVPELEDIGTMTEAFGQFWADLQEVPLVEAAQEVAPSFGAGACPVWQETIEIGAQSVDADFGFICTTWDDVTPVLSIVALVLWGLMAFRILFTA